MTLLELVENYGPIVYANSEMGFVIQRNGAYLNFGIERISGWEHADCRAVEDDAYTATLAQSMDEAKAWAKEILAGNDDES
jgi:hypothetical protein